MNNFILNNTPLFYWTQSLWRDEAFSYWISKDSFWTTITRTASDFNPPLYYLLLNLWIKFLGKSEIIMRCLSILFYLLLILVIYKFIYALFKSQKTAIYGTIITLLNPMLIYYAFEVRMYSLFALLATCSMYFLYKKNWKWYLLVSILGIYTQPFMFLLLLAQIPYFFITKQTKQGLQMAIIMFVAYLPWTWVIIQQFKQSGPMWMYPIDLNLIIAVLGNLFTGYEGTPGNFWNLMQWISLVIIILSAYLIKFKKYHQMLTLLLAWLFIPLTLVLLVSLKKPIYVNRYLIFATVAECLVIVSFFHSIKNKIIQNLVISLCVIGLIYLNIVATDFHRKIDLQSTFRQIIPIINSSDIIYAQTPLVFFESLYYAPKNIPVYLYNPHLQAVPIYVGSGGMPKSLWKQDYPLYPQKAFIIQESGKYDIVSKY